MDVHHTKKSPKLVDALKAYERNGPLQPISRGQNGGKLPKKACSDTTSDSDDSDFDMNDPSTHFRRPTSGASPLRCASSMGFHNEIEHEHRGRSFRSEVGIVKHIAFNTGKAVKVRARAASAVVDLSRPDSDQELHPASGAFAVDVVLIDPGRPQNIYPPASDFPRAQVEAIKNSDRFKLVKTFEGSPEIQEAMSQFKRQVEEAETTPRKEAVPGAKTGSVPAIGTSQHVEGPDAMHCDPSTRAILCDQAVLKVGWVKRSPNQELDEMIFDEELTKLFTELGRNRRRQQRGLLENTPFPHHPLHEPREAFIRGLTPDPYWLAKQARLKRTHVKEKSAGSIDSSIATSPPVRESATKKGPSKSLNPAAAEFVVRQAPLNDPAIIEQSINGEIKRCSDLAAIEKAAAKEMAVAQAFNDIANYSRESLNNLHEVVQDTIQKYGVPGVDVLQMPLPGLVPGHMPMDAMPMMPPGFDLKATGPLPGLDVPSMPPHGLPTPPSNSPRQGTNLTKIMTCPPPPGHGPGIGFGPGPLGPFTDWDALLFTPQPPLYGVPLVVPPMVPPMDIQAQQFAQQVPQQGSQQQFPPPFPPSFPTYQPPPPFSNRPAPRKPRVPNAVSQQEYEAHIEWRKANEPGYALKCKERQARRSARVGRDDSEAMADGSQPRRASSDPPIPSSSTLAVV